MEFKVITKTEEIAVIGFKTAKENRSIATTVREEKDKQIEKQRIERDAKEKKALEELYQNIMKAINKESEEGRYTLHIQWRESYKPFDISISVWELKEKEIKTFFGNLGYRVDDVYIYSDSWRNRSGKVGYVTISWR